MTKLTDLAHLLIKDKIEKSDLIVDATLGNGYDLLYVLDNCNPGASVLAFDIQEEAIKRTKEKLASKDYVVQPKLINDCHSKLDEYTDTIDLAIFNLGYLPGGDKNITTCLETSLTAIEKSISLLNPEGLISLMCYPGHTQGSVEFIAIKKYLFGLNSKYRVFSTRVEPYAERKSKEPPIHYLILS